MKQIANLKKKRKVFLINQTKVISIPFIHNMCVIKARLCHWIARPAKPGVQSNNTSRVRFTVISHTPMRSRYIIAECTMGCTQIAKTIGSISIRRRSDTFASIRCLTDVVPRVFGYIWLQSSFFPERAKDMLVCTIVLHASKLKYLARFSVSTRA